MTAPSDAPAKPGGRRACGAVRRTLPWVFVGLMACTVVAKMLRAEGYLFDLSANFAAHFACLSVALGVVAIVMRRWVAAGVLVAIAAVHVGWLSAGRAPVDQDHDGPTISVLQFNARTTNRTPERVVELIERADADLVGMVEVPDRSIELIRESASLREKYPYQSVPTHPDERNNIRLSKHPFEVLDLVDRSDPADLRRYVLGHTAVVDHPAGRFVHTVLIPISPRLPSHWAEGNATLRDDLVMLTLRLRDVDAPWIFGADMNAGPGTVRSADAMELGGLRRAKPLSVMSGTWPSWSFGPVRVAIDDLLVSSGVRVRSWRTVEGKTGSDHVPILVELAIDSPVSQVR